MWPLSLWTPLVPDRPLVPGPYLWTPLVPGPYLWNPLVPGQAPGPWSRVPGPEREALPRFVSGGVTRRQGTVNGASFCRNKAFKMSH